MWLTLFYKSSLSSLLLNLLYTLPTNVRTGLNSEKSVLVTQDELFLKMHFSFQYLYVYNVSQVRSTIKPGLPKSKPKGMTLTGLLERSVRDCEVNDLGIKGVFSIRCHFNKQFFWPLALESYI